MEGLKKIRRQRCLSLMGEIHVYMVLIQGGGGGCEGDGVGV